MRRITLAILAGAALASTCSAQAPPANDAPLAAPLTTVAALVEEAKSGAGGRYRVVGRLVNAGTNLFTDRRVVLVDGDTGETIAVQPWLPLEALPAQDPNLPQRQTLAEFLSREVELLVTPTLAPVKGVGVVPVLEVHAARVIGND